MEFLSQHIPQAIGDYQSAGDYIYCPFQIGHNLHKCANEFRLTFWHILRDQ